MPNKYIHRIILTFLCCFFCNMLFAESNPANQNQQENKTIVVTAAKPEFTLRLAANPTTGYNWFIKKYNSRLLSIEKHQFLPPTSQVVGAGGVDLWVFKVKPEAFKAPHLLKLKFVYARPWNVSDDGKEAEYTVVTQEKN